MKISEMKYGKLLKWIVIAAATVAVCFFCYYLQTEKRHFDHEFDGGSRVQADISDGEDSKRLLKLCKVWGFVKYYHPKVIKGDYNWDYELFRMINPVLDAENDEKVDEILYSWIDGLGKVQANSPVENGAVIVKEARTDWIFDTDYLSADLSGLLGDISKSYYVDKARSYVKFDTISVPNFDGEEGYPDMDYADQGYRLLALYRYWNIIEYYYPYIDIIDEDWDSIFVEFLPRFANGTDELSYKLACAELGSRIHDSHSYVFDDNRALIGGVNIAPFTFITSGGHVMVKSLDEDYPKGIPTVLPGDIILKADGQDIWELAAEKSKMKSRSRDTVLVLDLGESLFRGYEEEMTLTVRRDDDVMDIVVPCIVRKRKPQEPGEERLSHWLMEGNIGYINPGALKSKEISKIMEEFDDTRGVIVDLRNYPRDFIVFSMGWLIMPEPKHFATVSIPNLSVPGEFIEQVIITGGENPDYYKGKVALLMNECSKSQSEYTIMALRQAPNAVVIGSPSIGADGNVANMTLPGAVRTSMSSLGIYGPDMSQTQRVGLEPDIFVEPSVQGIREGRDELIEKAVEVILAD